MLFRFIDLLVLNRNKNYSRDSFDYNFILFNDYPGLFMINVHSYSLF